MITKFCRRNLSFAMATVVLACALTGCKRSEEAFDDRTLEKRPHTETVKPEDRKDAFRP